MRHRVGCRNPDRVFATFCFLRVLIKQWRNGEELILKPASVGGWRAEEVECRRRDDLGTEPERNADRRPLTEAGATAFPFEDRDERAGNDEGGPERY